MAMMTGRYAWRYAEPEAATDGQWGYLMPRFEPGTPTLGTILGRAGYRTNYVGRWHLGTRDDDPGREALAGAGERRL